MDRPEFPGKVTGSTEVKRPAKPKAVNPIESAVRIWLSKLPKELLELISLDLDLLVSKTPKRWTVYSPMVLLPSGSFGSTWEEVIPTLTNEHTQILWGLILQEVAKKEGKGKLTHLAVNSGIPLNKDSDPNSNVDAELSENVLRTPSGLVMLHGDFGPALSQDTSPTAQAFEEAFWVSTKQNGIIQIWAPRYTMFSRGNIKEKARLLDFHNAESRRVLTEELRNMMAIDLYAGIGYFVFSYVTMGLKRVVGWELNPWSVEGLRRGATANGWRVNVVRPDTVFEDGGENIVIFLEDNGMVRDRIASSEGKALMKMRALHVNCGLLPTSTPVWRTALDFLKGEGWLHLHENVGVDDIKRRASEIEAIFQAWESSTEEGRIAKVEHVELVKTFAPGVWHCVFDVLVCTASQNRTVGIEELQ